MEYAREPRQGIPLAVVLFGIFAVIVGVLILANRGTFVVGPGQYAIVEKGRGVEQIKEEGKYHYDGHRQCQVRLAPAETKRQHFCCPTCGRKVTVFDQ